MLRTPSPSTVVEEPEPLPVPKPKEPDWEESGIYGLVMDLLALKPEKRLASSKKLFD